jgi:predicted Zn-dependent protease
MSIFTGNKKWWYIGFFIFLTVTVGLIVFGELTHEEPGLERPEVSWPKDDFPLSVQATSHVPARTKEDRNAVKAAIKTTNDRLGFTAFKYDDDTDTAHVQVTVGVPQDSSLKTHADFDGQTLKDAGGAFLLKAYPGDKRWKECIVQTSNTGTIGLLHAVLQHELGHCLGLAHDDFESSIMHNPQKEWSGQGWPASLTDFDRNELRKRYAP